MAGKDMVVRSRTGSGKTIGFALPVIEKLIQEDHSSRGRKPRCIVLAPTRELAVQIHREFERIGPQLSTVCIYGGASYIPQESSLRRGVDIVVGTPGRVTDHMNKGTLLLDKVKMFILDEADEMLKMGFQEDVENIMKAVPEQGRQTNLWSATMPRWVQDLAKRYCTNLEFLDMVGTSTLRTADTIRHVAIAAAPDAKPAVIAAVVRTHARGGRALVFAQTKLEVDALASAPDLRGLARALHGDISQGIRERTLEEFREGRFLVLVATDVAARGIDVPEVSPPPLSLPLPLSLSLSLSPPPPPPHPSLSFSPSLTLPLSLSLSHLAL
jgi:ATP-dependent RNA helicase DDX21